MQSSSQLPFHSNTTAKLAGVRSPAWWQRRSKLEKILCIVTTIIIITCVGLCIALAVNGTKKHNNSGENNVCLTKGCVKSASAVIENMDETANPCDDFYQYSCGGFVARTVIPDDKMSVDPWELLKEDLNQRMRVTVEKPKHQSEPEFVWKIKDVYTACMNLSRIDFLGSKPLDDLLESMGGWPVVNGNSWKEDDFDWIKIMYKFNEAGISVNYLFKLSVDTDIKNTTHRLIDLDQPSFGMPARAYLLKGFNDPLVIAYYQLMVNVAVRLGASKNDAENQLKQSLEFEMTLANLSLPEEERRNFTKLYNKMTVLDLSKISSKIDWLEYFSTILSVDINPTEPVVVKVPKYLKDAINFIFKTPKRTIANYLLWRVAMDNIDCLDKEFRSTKMEYWTKLTGQTQETARWSHCMNVVLYSMPIALGSMYVRNYFDEDTKKAAVEMVADIRNEFDTILDELTWMNSETKSRAQEKLAAIMLHVAYPDELLNDKLLDNLYSDLSVSPDDHFGNLLSLQKYIKKNYFYSTLREPVDRTDWKFFGITTALVNAFCNLDSNSIYLPAGILQGIFFDSNRPRYLNYGAIGSVIGHEITHGFDDQGKQFDKDGNLRNWWDESTNEMFEEKTRCIIEQYSNYTVPEIGMKVNGFNTQGENIADNGGIKEAYFSYQKWASRNGVEPLLPGITLTQQQLFWLSFANAWCSKERPENLAVAVMTDGHSPSRFRVNGPLSNFAKFSEDFNCPKGSPMNPTHKCAVW